MNKWAIIVTGLFCVTMGKGQPSFTQNTLTTSVNGPIDVFGIDVDGDSDVDIISASSYDDKIAWYENDGSGSFTQNVISTTADDAYSVFGIDLDGDGDIDVLSSSAGDDNIMWYENDGSENFTSFTIATGNNPKTIVAIDFDGDGDIDVVSASQGNSSIYWHENNGAESFTTKVISNSTPTNSNRAIAAFDADGDADIDVISVSQDDKKLYQFTNDGTESFLRTIVDSTTSVNGFSFVYSIDLDGDGDTDAISGSSDSNYLGWYENDGSGNYTKNEIETFASHWSGTDYPLSACSSDMDGDGDYDIVLSGLRGENGLSLKWYKNNGQEVFTEQTITTTGDMGYGVWASDVDGDTDIDIIHCDHGGNSINWYENMTNHGPVWYVSTNGADSNDGSQTSQFATIQAGIDAAVDGDTVLVQPGTYVENINFNGKNIVLGSLFLTTQDTSYIAQTIIDGNGLPNVVQFTTGETNAAQLTGFTIQGGYYDGGNSAFNGAGILIDQASPHINHCVIKDNTISWYGGGICVWRPCSPVLDNLTIIGNTASYHGGGIAVLDGATPQISNSLIANNTTYGGWGGGVYVGGTGAAVTISNSTIVNNIVTNGYSNHWGGGIAIANQTTVSLVNSIVCGNTPNQIDDEFGQTHDVAYSSIEGGYTGTGNIHSDPLFVNRTASNYHILANSLCVNSGHPDSTDSDGTIADMGALPYINGYSGPDWYVSTTGSDEVGTGESNNPFASIQSGMNFIQNSESLLVQPGTYSVNINYGGKEITLKSIQGAESTIFTPANPNLPMVQFGANETASAILDGFSFHNAETAGGAISFGGNSNATVKNSIITNTISQHPITFNQAAGTLLNCIITDNEGYSPLYFYYVNGSKVVNCTFANNSAPDAGVAQISAGEAPSFINCIMWNEGIQELDGNADVSYSIVEGGYAGTMVLDQDPYFIDESTRDYRLHNYSPGIGAGTGTNAPVSDISGNPRPSPTGSSWDIGAYENAFGTPQHMPITINVPDDYATIQAGLNAADSTDTVLVQSGTYYENIIWPETNGIKLLSAGDSSNTIIDGGGLSSVIYMNPQTVTIDTTTLIHGFKITNGGNVIKGAGMLLEDASIKITNVSIVNNHTSYPWPDLWGGGMYLKNSNSVIRDLSISNNSSKSGGGIYISDSNPIIENVMIKGNSGVRGGGVSCQGSSILTMTNINLENNSATSGGGINASGGLISIENAFINGNTASNEGGGITLLAPAIFNDVVIKDNIAEQGGGIYTGGNQSLSMSDVSIIENTATGGFLGAGILFDSGSSTPTFHNVNIMYNHGDGIRTNSGNPNIVNTIAISNVNIIGNEVGVYAVFGTNPTINNSNILNNGDGFYNEYTINVNDATNNYWGHSSGPFHPSQNPTGQGDSVNTFVNVTPWLTTPNTDAPPIPAQDVIVSGTGNDFINLAWDPSPLGDFAGFKVYYDTDESGYPYDNSVDIGSSYTYALSGLNLGTEYFLAVTVYDTDGNESWYSNEVTGVTRVMEVQNLDIAGDEHLYHLVTHDPPITFDYFDSMGETQTNYQLQISTDSTFQSNLIWDSGEVASDATSIQYTGGALLDGVKYYLRAKVASGTFWSEWEDLAFGMNTEPSMPVQLSLIGDEVTTSDVLLEISNSIDAEEDNLTYDFRLYDATQGIQLDSANTVIQDPEGTEWEVTTALVDNSQHWWTVQAYDGYEYSELAGPESFLINLENDDPAGFDLTSPLLDEAIITQSPLFTWNPAVDPDPLDTVRYVLYLDTPDPGVEAFDVDIDTSYQLLDVLEDNTSYHWKVVAHDLAGATTTSTGGYQSFTVNSTNDLPVTFDLLSPVADVMVTTLTPEFLWEPSSDPDDETIVLRSEGKDRKAAHSSTGDNSVMVITGYDFYLGTDPILTDVIPVEVIGTNYTPETDLTENQVYYWTVSALDDSGGVTFSDTASFWTNSENSHPAVFTLLTPVDDTESTLTPTFTWTLSIDADLQDTLNYTLRYGADVFSLMDIPNGSSTQFTVVEPFMDNTEYIWQVVAEDISGATFATEFSSFFVNSENDDPGLFSLIAPDSASWITNPDLMLVWDPSTDLEGAEVEYVIHMGADNESLNPIDTIGVNYLALNELEDGYYFWQIEALDNIGGTQFSETWSFLINVHNDPPDPFALVYPEADLVLTEQQPTFTWDASSSGDAGDHTSYRVELGSSAENMGVVYEGDSTFYTPELALEDNIVYFWRVIAIDLAFATTVNEGGYQSFVVNTVNDAPTMAGLISPDSVVVLSDLPTFNWNASTDVDPYDSLSYELHWWTDVSEMDSILTAETSVSPETPLADDNLQYFWNVITMDANGGIAHSEEKTFWVDFMPEVPASFALIGPDSASAGNGTRPELTWAEAIDPDPFDAVHYSVSIATDSLMENVIYEQVAHAEVTIPETDLENDTRYYWQVTAIDEDSLTTASSIWTFDVGYVAIDQYAQVPTEFVLDQNYPNPFNPSTTIRYGLPEETNVSLVIYDVRGTIVHTLESGHQSAGWYDVVWNGQTADGKTISTGIYFARLVAGEYSQVVKMLYLK
jgi:hypothetical protein